MESSESWLITLIIFSFFLSSWIVKLFNLVWISSRISFWEPKVIFEEGGNSKGWKKGLEDTPPSRGKEEGASVEREHFLNDPIDWQ